MTTTTGRSLAQENQGKGGTGARNLGRSRKGIVWREAPAQTWEDPGNRLDCLKENLLPQPKEREEKLNKDPSQRHRTLSPSSSHTGPSATLIAAG